MPGRINIALSFAVGVTSVFFIHLSSSCNPRTGTLRVPAWLGRSCSSSSRGGS